MERLRVFYYQADDKITLFMRRNGILFLRVSLGIIFFWFGFLKFFPGLSPADQIATVTIEKLRFGVSFAVNPLLVKFMENLRYIDQLGRGLPMVWQEAVCNGRKVQFKEIGEEFKVMLEVSCS